MILSDREVQVALDDGLIYIIDRPGAEMFSSTSVDLTLDKDLRIWNPKPSPTEAAQEIRPFRALFDVKALLNDDRWADKVTIDSNGFRFDQKGHFILAYTRERICLPHRSRIAARVEGKSSLARLGIGVHLTAPTIHAGFGYKRGIPASQTAQPIQLEMFSVSGLPVVLEVGMPICQLIFEEVREVPLKEYSGQFNEQPVFAQPESPRKKGK